MAIVLLGAGNIEKHSKIIGKSTKQIIKEIDKISENLIELQEEIILLPDKGIPFEIAKKVREKSNLKIIATLPKNDKTFGIKHLEPYLKYKIDGKKVFSEIINTENWYKQDMCIGLFGKYVLVLGLSLGVLDELMGSLYLKKIIRNIKKIFKKPKIHHKIWKKEPTIMIYKPLCLTKLPKEIEKYIKKDKIANISYINKPQQIKQIWRKAYETERRKRN